MAIWDKALRVEMPDGSVWQVPVSVVALNRARAYADEFDGDVERSLREDTLPLFESDEFEIRDWAANNMNWSDVADKAIQLPTPSTPVDYEEGWVNGKKAIVDPA